MKKIILLIAKWVAVLIAVLVVPGLIVLAIHRQNEHVIALENTAALSDNTAVTPEAKAEAVAKAQKTIKDENEWLERVNQKEYDITNRNNDPTNSF